MRKIIAAVLVACAFIVSSADAAPYISLVTGATFSPDTSNLDVVEFGREPGYMVGIAAGGEHEMEQYALRVEAEGLYLPKSQHGDNRNPNDHRSADGRTLQAGTILVNAWPAVHVTDEIDVYAGGGAGIGIRSDRGVSAAYQVGLGASYDFGAHWRADGGFRYRDVAGYDTYGPVAAISYRF